MIRLLVILLFIAIGHIVAYQPSEPFYNNDETRHVMTGAFFQDLWQHGSVADPKSFAMDYYQQYPALGLLIWPPLFHMIEGLWMSLFGFSVITSKLLVLAFLALACLYCYRIVRLTNSREQALLATSLVAFSPMGFEFSGQVMLEIPTLACCLVSIFYFMRYLDTAAAKHLAFSATAAVVAAMTKYDAYYLLLLYPLLMIGNRPLEILKRRHAWITVLTAAIAVAPMAYLTAREVGALHLQSMKAPQDPVEYSNWAFYLIQLPAQLGWPTFLAALAGIVACINRAGFARMRPHIAIIAATYLAFASIGEQDMRHTIYWIPAWAAFAGEGIRYFVRPLSLRRRDFVQAAMAALTLFLAITAPRLYVRGYEAAAKYVLHNGSPEKVVFDGGLNGNFIFQMRRLDPNRQSTVIRADKILYHSLGGYKSLGYEEYVRTDQEILDRLAANRSRYIVVESKGYRSDLPIANRLRGLLHSETDRFRRVSVIPIDTNNPSLKAREIEIFEQIL